MDREEPFLASSFHPPDNDSAAASSYPAWVLLDKKAYIADRENATTATAISRTGHSVKVTFCLADPPAVSHFCVHCPAEHLADEPRVLSSEKDLVLLSFVFTAGGCHHGECFVYRAGRGKPSLEPIPDPPPETTRTICVSLVPCDDDDGEFALADLCATATLGHYDVTVFSSKTAKWTARRLPLHSSSAYIRAEDLLVVPHKAITLPGGLAGWVDPWRGIIVCKVLQEDPFVYFIPLPKPDFNLSRMGNPKPVRDVICNNDGVIKLVEMDHYFKKVLVRPTKRFKVTKDLDSADRIYDRDILLLPHEAFLEGPKEETILVPDGWKIRTCYRRISWDHWRTGHSVHVDDISVDNPKHSLLVPQLWDAKAGRSTLRNMTTFYPTLSPNADDVVYMMSQVEYLDKNSWMVGVDLGNKTVQTLEPYCAERATSFKPDCLPCTFSGFLNTIPRSCAEEKATFSSSEAQNRVPQPLHPNLTSSRSAVEGHAHPVNSQSMYPDPVLGRDAHGKLEIQV